MWPRTAQLEVLVKLLDLASQAELFTARVAVPLEKDQFEYSPYYDVAKSTSRDSINRQISTALHQLAQAGWDVLDSINNQAPNFRYYIGLMHTNPGWYEEFLVRKTVTGQ